MNSREFKWIHVTHDSCDSCHLMSSSQSSHSACGFFLSFTQLFKAGLSVPAWWPLPMPRGSPGSLLWASQRLNPTIHHSHRLPILGKDVAAGRTCHASSPSASQLLLSFPPIDWKPGCQTWTKIQSIHLNTHTKTRQNRQKIKDFNLSMDTEIRLRTSRTRALASASRPASCETYASNSSPLTSKLSKAKTWEFSKPCFSLSDCWVLQTPFGIPWHSLCDCELSGQTFAPHHQRCEHRIGDQKLTPEHHRITTIRGMLQYPVGQAPAVCPGEWPRPEIFAPFQKVASACDSTDRTLACFRALGLGILQYIYRRTLKSKWSNTAGHSTMGLLSMTPIHHKPEHGLERLQLPNETKTNILTYEFGSIWKGIQIKCFLKFKKGVRCFIWDQCLLWARSIQNAVRPSLVQVPGPRRWLRTHHPNKLNKLTRTFADRSQTPCLQACMRLDAGDAFKTSDSSNSSDSRSIQNLTRNGLNQSFLQAIQSRKVLTCAHGVWNKADLHDFGHGWRWLPFFPTIPRTGKSGKLKCASKLVLGCLSLLLLWHEHFVRTSFCTHNTTPLRDGNWSPPFLLCDC